MQLVLGSYAFPVNGTEITSQSKLVWSDSGIPYAINETIRVAGYLLVNGQADCTYQENLLRLALSIPYQNLLLLDDTAALTAVKSTVSGSVTGPQLVEGPHFPEWKAGEYGVQRRFEFTVMNEYANPQLAGGVTIEFYESLTFGGGFPEFRFYRALNGPPQKQMVWPQTEYTVIQAGWSVGHYDYPAVPPPLWPFDLLESPVTKTMSPKRRGLGYDKYRVEWEYRFGSANPFAGLPHTWF